MVGKNQDLTGTVRNPGGPQGEFVSNMMEKIVDIANSYRIRQAAPVLSEPRDPRPR